MVRRRINNGERIPYSIEIKIYDQNRTPIFHWRPARGNVQKGLEKTEEFIEEKLGVDLETEESKLKESIIGEEVDKGVKRIVESFIGKKA